MNQNKKFCVALLIPTVVMCATVIYSTDNFHNTSVFVMLMTLTILPIDLGFLGMQVINSILSNTGNVIVLGILLTLILIPSMTSPSVLV